MANQYTENFTHVIQRKFNKSAEVLLTEYAKNGVSYSSACRITGYKKSTIRKWCIRYGVSLSGVLIDRNKTDKIDLGITTFNRLNFLYRKWPTTGLWFNLA